MMNKVATVPATQRGALLLDSPNELDLNCDPCNYLKEGLVVELVEKVQKNLQGKRYKERYLAIHPIGWLQNFHQYRARST